MYLFSRISNKRGVGAKMIFVFFMKVDVALNLNFAREIKSKSKA